MGLHIRQYIVLIVFESIRTYIRRGIGPIQSGAKVGGTPYELSWNRRRNSQVAVRRTAIGSREFPRGLSDSQSAVGLSRPV